MNKSTEREPVHPIADHAFALLSRPDGKTYALSDSGKKKIIVELERVQDPRELYVAVMSLVSLARWLEGEKSERASAALVDVATTASPMLRMHQFQAEKKSQERGTQVSKQFTMFGGQDVVLAAPRFGVPPKEGTITIAALNAAKPRRIK